MFIFSEVVLTAIINAVIGEATGKGAAGLSSKVREKLGLDPTHLALKAALQRAFTRLAEQHPQWVASNFDASFFAHEGAPVLAQFLVMHGRPDPSELAQRWANSLNIQDKEQRTHHISELEPIAADFLHDLAQQLKAEEALRDLNESRTLDRISDDIQALRQHLAAEKATFGTRRDYLDWLIDRNLYLDPRGTFQTQRQVQLKLDTIYISLQAQPSESLSDTLSPIDRLSTTEELTGFELEASRFNQRLGRTSRNRVGETAEEREDKRDLLLHRDRLGRNRIGETLVLAEAINRYDHLVILGDPGSGKTTLLRYLALHHALALRDGREEAGEKLGKPRFPLLIRIAEYAEGGIWKQQALGDYLAQCCTVHACPKKGLEDLLQSELEEGECLILLDGLDEIVSADERSGVVRQIEDFVRRYDRKGNRFVITSRIAGYSSAPLSGPFTHYTVRDMDDAQIQHFLERWCRAVEDAETPELSAQERARITQREIDAIMQAIKNPGVHRLAVNPLLLRILALIQRTGAKLPHKRVELYKLAADTLARTWRPAQGVADTQLHMASALLKEDYLTPLLSELAYWLHTNKPTGVATEREVYEVLGEAWARMNALHWDADNPLPSIHEEIRKFLVAVHTHTGLFVERAPKRYGFVHLTFEEYYAARYLVASSRKRAKLIRKHLHQPRWQEPILLAIGFVGLDYPKEASELVEGAILAKGELAEEQALTPSPYENLLGRDYLFALRCLADNIPVQRNLMNALTTRLTSEYLNSTGLARFQRYRQALDKMLTQMAGSDSANALIPYLNEQLHDDQVEALVRINASKALGKLGSSSAEAIEALLTVLQDNQAAAEVRSYAAEALGEVGNTSGEVIEALLAVLRDSQIDLLVHFSASHTLEELGNTSVEVIEALFTVLQDSQGNARVRNEIAYVLGELGNASMEVIEALFTVLQDSQVDTRVRSRSAYMLGRLANASMEVIEALLTVLRDSQADAEVRSSAAFALGRLRNASVEVIEALLAVLQDSQVDVIVRSRAAIALEELGQLKLISSSGVITIICNLFREAASSYTRPSLARMLGHSKCPDDTILTTLWQGLLDTDNDVRRVCAQTLAQFGRKQSTHQRQDIEKKFVESIDDPAFEVCDNVERPAYDYAYDGLWALVVDDDEGE